MIPKALKHWPIPHPHPLPVFLLILLQPPQTSLVFKDTKSKATLGPNKQTNSKMEQGLSLEAGDWV